MTPLKILQACFLFVSLLLLSSCVITHRELEQAPKTTADLQVKLNQYKQSNFKQVEATFFN